MLKKRTFMNTRSGHREMGTDTPEFQSFLLGSLLLMRGDAYSVSAKSSLFFCAGARLPVRSGFR